MRRINEGMYTKEMEILVNGKKEIAEFRVFKVNAPHPKNPQKVIQTPLWSFDCPKFNVLGTGIFEKKAYAMEAMEEACKIGFRTMPVKATMLAIEPTFHK